MEATPSCSSSSKLGSFIDNHPVITGAIVLLAGLSFFKLISKSEENPPPPKIHPKKVTPISISTIPFSFGNYQGSSSSTIGKRERMEDREFTLQLQSGDILLGVLDGHGGSQVADYAAKKIPKIFEKILEGCSHNIPNALTATIKKIDSKTIKKSWECVGSTALFCYIDQKIKKIFIANVGDCEALLIKKSGEMKQISQVETWGSPEAIDRLVKYHNHFNTLGWNWEAIYFQNKDPKEVRPNIYRSERGVHFEGPNLSRALGDNGARYRGTEECPLILSDPLITEEAYEEGDKLVMACDGLWDCVKNNEELSPSISPSPEETTKNLVEYALKKGSNDNITVMALNL